MPGGMPVEQEKYFLDCPGLNGEAAIYAIAKEIVTDGRNSMRGNTPRAQSILEATLNYRQPAQAGNFM